MVLPTANLTRTARMNDTSVMRGRNDHWTLNIFRFRCCTFFRPLVVAGPPL